MKVTITPKIVNNYLSKKQLNSLRAHEDTMDPIIGDIVARIRAEVLSIEGNIFPSDKNTVPDFLVVTACHLIIEALQTRYALLRLTPDQVRNADNARKFLRRIALGEIRLAPQSSIVEPHTVFRMQRGQPNPDRINLKDLKGF